MTTRRELLKIASALGIAGSVPAMAERVTVAQVLGEDGPARPILNPATFAIEIHREMGNLTLAFGNDWYGVLCPEEGAELSKMSHALRRVASEAGINLFDAVGDFEGAAVSMFLAMYEAGLRHGASYENLRRSIVGETVGCLPCQGVGLSQAGETCGNCGGTGTVALTDSKG